MNRRGFIAGTIATAPSLAFWRKAEANPPPTQQRTVVMTMDTTKVEDLVTEHLRKRMAITPELQPPIKGVLGETYFKVRVKPGFPGGKRLLLNGVNVTTRSFECDLVAGWVRMCDVDANGIRILPRIRCHYGKVEIH